MILILDRSALVDALLELDRVDDALAAKRTGRYGLALTDCSWNGLRIRGGR